MMRSIIASNARALLAIGERPRRRVPLACGSAPAAPPEAEEILAPALAREAGAFEIEKEIAGRRLGKARQALPIRHGQELVNRLAFVFAADAEDAPARAMRAYVSREPRAGLNAMGTAASAAAAASVG